MFGKNPFLLSLLLVILVSLIYLISGSGQGYVDGSPNQTKSILDREKIRISNRKTQHESLVHSNRVFDSEEPELHIEYLPVEIDDWEVSEEEKKLFSELSDKLKKFEVLRIVHEGHSYGVSDPKGDSTWVLQVDTVIRPPNQQETSAIFGEIDEALSQSSQTQNRNETIRSFFADRFSLETSEFKILTTNCVRKNEEGEISRYVSARLASDFILADGDDGEVQVQVVGTSRNESSYTNPSNRRVERYSHLVDPKAGQ
jgi:hypothetical protein